MAGFRKLGEELLHSGHVIDLYRDRIEAPDGSVIVRDVVRHPGAVAVVPVLDDGTVVLVRQFRAPLSRDMLEIPAGKLDVDGEPLEIAAGRELAEEVGLEAGSMELLVRFHNSVGFCDEESHVFLATELSEVPTDRQGVEEANMTEVRVPLAESGDYIASGEITDAKTVLGLMAARERLGVRAPRDNASGA